MHLTLALALPLLAASTQAQSICHVISWTGSACSSNGTSTNATSSAAPAGSSCTYESTCMLPRNCDSALLPSLGQGANSSSSSKTTATASSTSASPTGLTRSGNMTCIGSSEMQALCDGSIVTVQGNSSTTQETTYYQCLCDDNIDSCPAGTALSISYANGSSSTSNLPAGNTAPFSFSYTDLLNATSTRAATSTPVASTTVTARTTFVATFGAAAVNTAASTGGGVAGQAAQPAPTQSQTSASMRGFGLSAGLSLGSTALLIAFGFLT